MQPRASWTFHIPVQPATNKGSLSSSVPENAMISADIWYPPEQPVRGWILFAHGSGSSRFSPRNQAVAQELQRHRLAAVLLDLLTPYEEHLDSYSGEFRFNIPLLTRRLMLARIYCQLYLGKQAQKWGYFGASTGAAAALMAAAPSIQKPFIDELPLSLRYRMIQQVSQGQQWQQVSPDKQKWDVTDNKVWLKALAVDAVVSRGGRVDLAEPIVSDPGLPPSLILVGSYDHMVLEMTKEVVAEMKSKTQLTVIPGASHLFEERGKLEEVAKEAAQFFVDRFQ